MVTVIKCATKCAQGYSGSLMETTEVNELEGLLFDWEIQEDWDNFFFGSKESK